jgi:hypothetical protein
MELTLYPRECLVDCVPLVVLEAAPRSMDGPFFVVEVAEFVDKVLEHTVE